VFIRDSQDVSTKKNHIPAWQRKNYTVSFT
jgi:hypothetical protein